MARIASQATVVNNTTGNHTAVPVSAGGESGHLYVSYDNTQVTSYHQLHQLMLAALVVLSGQLKA